MLPYYQFTTYQIGPLTFQVWGTFVAAGIAVALYLGYRECKQRGLNQDNFLSLALWATVAALVCARLFYIALFWSDFASNFWSIFEVWNGGMVAYGGVVGAVACIWFYAKYRKLDVVAYLDVVALVFPAGYAIGRIGCHLIRDHMGKLTGVPWGFVVSQGQVRHDTAVYSIIVGIILFLIFWPRRKNFTVRGQITVWTAFLYSATRFIIDSFRATDIPGSDPRFFGLTVSQYISAFVFLVCGYLLFRGYRRKKVSEIH